VPEVSITVSLLVIVGVLAGTTVASLLAVRRRPELAEGHGTSVSVPVAHTREEAEAMDRHDREIDAEMARRDREHS
jgi:tellurite resistance protein TerC